MSTATPESSKKKTPEKKPPTDRVEIEKVGPLKNTFSFPMPKNGGLVVLRAVNGGGKSTLLAAIDKSLGRDVKLRKTEGSIGSGHFEAPWGTSIKLGQSARVSGELTFKTLDDEFNLGDLVMPREQDPAAADRRRIRALLRVAGAKVTPEVFQVLFENEEEFLAIVDPDELKTDDPVQMASGIKRCIESRCRSVEQQREAQAQKVLALQELLKGIDLESAVDLASLQSRYETAVTERTNGKNARLKYLEAQEVARKLRENIVKQEQAGGVSKDEIRAEITTLEAEETRWSSLIEDTDREIAALQWQVEELRQKQQTQASSRDMATQKIKTAKANFVAMTQSGERLDQDRQALQTAEAVPEVTPEKIQELETAVEGLRKLVTDAEILVRNQSKVAELDTANAEANRLQKQAEYLRDAARGTESVLSDLIKGLGTPIKVGIDDLDRIRLIVPHEERGTDVYFSELSPGEALALVLEIAINSVKTQDRGGVFTIPQNLFEGLDPINQNLILEKLRGTGVVAITAACSDDPEIHAEIRE